MVIIAIGEYIYNKNKLEEHKRTDATGNWNTWAIEIPDKTIGIQLQNRI